MANATFILDDNYQHVAIYVDDYKFGDIDSVDDSPSYPGTWFDLIKNVRNFNEIKVFHLSSYGIQHYLRKKYSFPEQLSAFKSNELCSEDE